jgi:hypothetical protein
VLLEMQDRSPQWGWLSKDCVMTVQTIVISAVMFAFWLFGLIEQLYSKDAIMRYLALSAAVVAVFVWRLRPRPALRRRPRDQGRRPPE